MAILYPPYIEGTIPAFVGNTLEVPYMMNKTVGYGDIKGFRLKIKNIQTNDIVTSATSTNFGNDIVTFELPSGIKMKVGKFYKIQIAYISKDTQETGYYSTIGVVKKTSAPAVRLINKQGEELSKTTPSMDTKVYVGSYINSDTGEKVYSYRFDIYDNIGNLFATSGDLLHNHENDTESNESHDEFILSKELEDNKIYKIKYTVTTINNYTTSSYEYRIARKTTIDPIIQVGIQAKENKEDGYVKINFIELKQGATQLSLAATGTFVILRASDEDNFQTWHTLSNFKLEGQLPKDWSWKDYTVQHGHRYVYALQQYNKTNQIFSNKRYSECVEANFEHCYLFDGEKQLKIKFNPKISSYKRNRLETKLDTLGGKYPQFYRNGNTDYKEFPISGLISYLSDENELFLTDEELGLYGEREWKNQKLQYSTVPENGLSNRISRGKISTVNENNRNRTTNLTHYNIYAEKIFRDNVLEFLTNGKPKLFKSPTESNAIVRLMNTSLTPNDQLGRMLYTFNCTAYEVDNLNFDTLNKHGFITTSDPYIKQLKVHTVIVRDFIESIKEENEGVIGNIEKYKVNKHMAYFIDCKDMWPGDYIIIDGKKYIIGSTGSYFIQLKDKSFNTINIGSNHSGNGSITYGYYSADFDIFSLIKDVKLIDRPIIQIFGSEETDTNILAPYVDTKHVIGNFYYLRFTKKQYVKELPDGITDELKKFYVVDSDYDPIYNPSIPSDTYKITIKQQTGYDETGNEEYENVLIDITDTDGYQLYSHDNIQEIYLGKGIIAELSLSQREIIYTLEESNSKIRQAKNNYTTAVKNYNNNLNSENRDGYLETMEDKYEIFINALDAKIEELKVGGA